MVQGSTKCVKYCMFGFNFVFVICGIILIVVGSIASTKDVTRFLNNKFFTIPTILIVLGVIVFLLAFLGCCGAAKEQKWMITLFGFLLFLIFLVGIGSGIAGYVYRNDIQSFVKTNLNESISQGKKDAMKFWDETQSEAKCCGVDGAQDYLNNHKEIPKSCCPPESETCDENSAFHKGCYDVIMKMLKENIGLVAGVGVGIAVVELLGVIFAYCLVSAIRRDYEGV